MTDRIDIRETLTSDHARIETLYAAAFPEEDLLALIGELLDHPDIVLSLTGVRDAALVGHVMFTTCHVAGTPDQVALLGPLAVAPERQRQGIGGAMVRAGLERLTGGEVRRVFVLGDPGYYGRLGFGPENTTAPPYPLPDEWQGAWQSCSLGDGVELGAAEGSKIIVPPPWRKRALWAP